MSLIPVRRQSMLESKFHPPNNKNLENVSVRYALGSMLRRRIRTDSNKFAKYGLPNTEVSSEGKINKTT